MRTGQAFVAGVVGGVTMTVLQWLVRTFMGMTVNIEMIWGTMFLPNSGGAWLLGFVIHLLVSGVIGLIYALAFELVTHRAGAGLGAGFSLVHSVFAGLFMGVLPAMHPRIPEAVPAPGFFMSAMGVVGIVVLLLIHAAYGAVVGALYHPVQYRAHHRHRSYLRVD